MKKLNKREIILAVVSTCLLAVFFLVQNVIKPLQEEGEGIDQQLQVSESRLLKVRKILAGSGHVDEWYGRLIDMVGTTDAADRELPGLITQLGGMAGEENVQVAQLDPQRVVDENDIVFVPVQMELSGKWADVVRFLARVQAAPEYFFINELSLQKNADNSGNVYGRVTLSRMKLKSVL